MCVYHVPQKTVHLKLRLVKFNHVLLGKSRGQFGMSCIITYWSIQWGPPLYQSTNQWENESVWLFCWDMFRRVSTPLKNIGQLGLLFPIYGNILCPHLQRKIHPSIPGNAPKKTPHRPFTQLAHNFLIKFGLLMVKSSVCVVKLHVQHD